MAAWIEVLTDPATFFRRRQDDPDLRGPVLIVLVVGVLGLLSAVPAVYLVLRGMPTEAQPIIGAGLAIGAALGLVGPFVVWLVYALLFYGISAVFGGEGSFRDLFILTGWGFLPRVLGAAVSAIVLFAVLGTLPAPESAEAVSEFQRQLQTNPLVQGSSLFGIAITLWSGYIWTHAVAVARELTIRQAAVTVGIPVVISIAWTFLGVVGFQLF